MRARNYAHCRCTDQPTISGVFIGSGLAGQGQVLARIFHQAAQDTDKTLALWSKAWIVKNTVCYSSMPITVQAGLRLLP